MAIDQRAREVSLLLDRINSYDRLILADNFEPNTVSDIKNNAKDICNQIKSEVDLIKGDIDGWS